MEELSDPRKYLIKNGKLNIFEELGFSRFHLQPLNIFLDQSKKRTGYMFKVFIDSTRRFKIKRVEIFNAGYH